ncbi:MAG: Methylmalonyl-CoA epimerase [Candidatus Bathyarchaeota archaeon BA1]|nr:MAG: Methylmalonyl-CoA epimerase [Candidatus Bathyarchaeota archaeon BA1]
MNQMIKKIDHVGIGVRDLNEAMKFYKESLCLEVEGIEEVIEQKVKIAFIPVGESRIELLQSTDPEGPIATFITKRGEGIHHIALEVDRIEDALQRLREDGIQLIDEKPRVGAHRTKIAFLHPRSTKGVLLELCEKQK